VLCYGVFSSYFYKPILLPQLVNMHRCLKCPTQVYHRAVIKFTVHLSYRYHQNDHLYSADLHQSQEDTLAKVVDIHPTPSVANPLILLTATYWP